MSEEHDYYRVTGGPIMDAIKQWQSERNAAEEKLAAFAERVGAVPEHFYGNEQCISALKFETVPEGWRPEAGAYGWHCPSGKTKEGRALRAEMRQLGVPGAQRFTELVGIGLVIVGTRIKRAGFARYGDSFVLVMPKVAKFTAPEGCEPIKTSEYWALREAHQEVLETV